MCPTRSLKFHSQAYIFTTRIPAIISLMISNRLSVCAAALLRTRQAFLAATDP